MTVVNKAMLKTKFTVCLCRQLLQSSSRHVSNSAIQHGKVGFVGLGNMGGPMAMNLIKTGHSILAYDLSPDLVKKVESEGAEVATSPAEVAENVDRIVTMLPNSEAVKQVYTSGNGIFATVKKGTLMIDSSTIDPSTSQEMSAKAEKLMSKYMDAPVSGGVNAAKAASLTFMVGGDEHEFEPTKELLKNMGKNVVYCGKVGTGQAAKICNNMLLAISMIGTSEAMNLGIRLGLDPKLLAGVLNTSSGRCWSSELYNPCPGVLPNVPSSNQYQGGFGTALMTKDLGLAQGAAKETGTITPLGAVAYQMYQLLCAHGSGGKDFSCVYEFIQKQTEK